MTPREMQIEFSQYFESENSIPVPIKSKEIFFWLNSAQDEFVKTRYNGLNVKRQGFEQSQERVDDLSLLLTDVLVDAEYANSQYGIFDSDLLPYPDNYLRLIKLKCNIRYKIDPDDITSSGDPAVRSSSVGTEPTKIVNVKISQQDDIYRLLEDPFNRSSHKQPISIFNNEGVLIYTDNTFIVLEGYMTYLKEPARIALSVDGGSDQECELPSFLHKEIVDMAIRMYRENRTRLVPQEQLN